MKEMLVKVDGILRNMCDVILGEEILEDGWGGLYPQVGWKLVTYLYIQEYPVKKGTIIKLLLLLLLLLGENIGNLKRIPTKFG